MKYVSDFDQSYAAGQVYLHMNFYLLMQNLLTKALNYTSLSEQI